MNFDKEFEDDILSQCLKDVNFLKKASRICRSHHFCNKQRSWLWDVIYYNWSKNKEITTGKIISRKAKRDFKDKEKRKPYIVLARNILQRRPDNPETILGELERFVRFVNLQLTLEKSVSNLEKENIDEAENVLNKHARTIAKKRKYTHISWIEEFEERQARRKYERLHPNEFVTIPIGFKKIDRALNGGGRKGEVALILATTGVGKSILITNSVMKCVSNGYRAAYFSLEMPARQIATRQDSLWSGIEYGKFKSYDFLPSERKIIKRKLRHGKKLFSNKLHIFSMPVKSANIFDIKNALDDVYEEYGFRADAVYLDSADHLKSLDNYGGNYRLQQAEVFWGCKELAEEDGYFVMSSTHAGRQWAGKVATSEATSETYDKSRIADLVISLNDYGNKQGRKTILVDEEDDDEEDELEDLSLKEKSKKKRLFTSKYRDGESGFEIPVYCEYSKMIISDWRDEEDEEDD